MSLAAQVVPTYSGKFSAANFATLNWWESVAEAGPVETFGFGSRSTSMGGAVSADVHDVSANFYNPAGLVTATALSIEVGIVRTLHALKMNGRDNHVDPMRALVFGLVAPGEIAHLPFALGVALHLPDDRVFRVRSLDQTQPRWEMYDNQVQRIFFAVNLAIRPVKWLELGGGLAFLASTRARLDISGQVDLTSPNESTLRHEVDADLTSGRYPQAGLRIIPSERTRFALVYRGEFQLTFDIDAQLKVDAQALGLHVPLYTYLTARSINAFLPRQLVIGGSHDATDWFTIDADLTFVNWAAYQSPATLITARTEVGKDLPSSFTPEKPAPTVIIEPRFQNRFVPRVGVEARLPIGRSGSAPDRIGHELGLRAGYFFERSPIPPQSNGTNFVDADRHAFTVGAGVKLHHLLDEFPGDVRFDVHAMFSYLPERIVRKESPADLIGDYRASGTIWSLGSMLSVSFQ
ncbi:MAG: hypothetical protein NVSMB1_13670 [Polyangiales bacterium]